MPAGGSGLQPSGRAMIDMPKRSASSTTSGWSITIVLAASIARTRRAGPMQVLDRRHADRWARRTACPAGAWRPLPGSSPRPGKDSPARSMQRSVPSMASTAKVGLFLDGHRLADVKPAHLLGHHPAEFDVASSAAVGARRVRIPSFTSNSGQKSSAEANVIPSRSNSWITESKSESSRLSARERRYHHCKVRKSGQS